MAPSTEDARPMEGAFQRLLMPRLSLGFSLTTERHMRAAAELLGLPLVEAETKDRG